MPVLCRIQTFNIYVYTHIFSRDYSSYRKSFNLSVIVPILYYYEYTSLHRCELRKLPRLTANILRRNQGREMQSTLSYDLWYYLPATNQLRTQGI